MIPVRGHLIVDAEPGQVDEIAEKFAQGPVDLCIESIAVTAEGELMRHDLRPQLIEHLELSVIPRSERPSERAGPLVRVYATHPDEEA